VRSSQSTSEDIKKALHFQLLSERIDKVLPRLIKRAERLSRDGVRVEVSAVVTARFGLIAYTHPGTVAALSQREILAVDWIIDYVGEKLQLEGSLLRPYFYRSAYSMTGVPSANRLVLVQA
jgi:hypothetical protein